MTKSVARTHSHADRANDTDDDMFAVPGDHDPEVMNSAAQARLKSFIERIERLEEEKASIANDIKEVKAEAKGEGFDVRIINRVVALRKMDKAKRQEAEALLDLYLAAIGEI
jgi:uncharacterized protein (UPF0335 family)